MLVFSARRCSVYWERGARTLRSRACSEFGRLDRATRYCEGGGAGGVIHSAVFVPGAVVLRVIGKEMREHREGGAFSSQEKLKISLALMVASEFAKPLLDMIHQCRLKLRSKTADAQLRPTT
jgi:hypothetical protein